MSPDEARRPAPHDPQASDHVPQHPVSAVTRHLFFFRVLDLRVTEVQPRKLRKKQF